MAARGHWPARILVSVCVAGAAGLCGADEPSRLRVLLLSGQNNHDWRQTTPIIRGALEKCGRFVVDVTEHPERVTAETLRAYAVVVSNWNSFHRDQPPPVVDWPPETRRAFVDFVRNGGGFVTVHAGGSSFYDDTWPTYHELVIARYGFGQTAHGVQHVFAVQIEDVEHPVTRGMRDFFLHDELWHRTSVVAGATVLASAFSSMESKGSGQYEPVAFVRRFGQGRCFATLLGHGPRALRNPAFASLLARGTEWAATGEVTLSLPANWPTTPVDVTALEGSLDDALAAVRTYRFGDDRTALQVVAAALSDAAVEPQLRKLLGDRLAEMLGGESTVEGKRFLCIQLGRIGSTEHVPALLPLLAEPELTVAARGALETIPGPEAVAALRAALASNDGEIRVGLINSLGRVRDSTSVPLIARLAKSEDHETRAAAIAALGCIGSPAASEALRRLQSEVGDDVDLADVWADALLASANALQSTGDSRAAAAAYETLSAPELPVHVRIAALTGYFRCQDQLGSDLLWGALLGEDPTSRQAALRALREFGGTSDLEGLAARLSDLPNDLKPSAIALLAARGISSSLPAIVAASEHRDAAIRREALVGLGVLGDASTIDILLERLDGASRDESEIIIESLTRLRGEDVNARMIELAQTVQPARAAALATVLVARQATEARPALLALMCRPETPLADEAVRAVGELGDVDSCDELIALLGRDNRAASADVIRRAIVQTAQRSGDDPARPVLSALVRADESLTIELLPVLSTLGGPAALKAVNARTTSNAEEVRLAAIRALSSWEDAAALRPLLTAARSRADVRARTLALRGFSRLLPEATELSPQERSGLLKQALVLAQRADEKRALLGCASSAGSIEALRWAMQCLDDPEVTREAALTVLALSEQLHSEHKEDVVSALRRLLNVSEDAGIRANTFRQLARSGGLTDLARRARADSPDGIEPDFGGEEASAVNDGNLDTYWDEENGQPLYRLRLTFDEPTTIATIAITGYKHHYAAPRDFSISCDGNEIAAVAGIEYADNHLLVDVPETTCTVLELEITGYYGPSPGVRELEVYGPAAKDMPMQLGWQRAESTLTLVNHGRPVWTFRFGQDLPKPYFHPVALLDGTTLTWASPADHPWHHGHWFSWKYINNVNYWEENRETGLSDGRTSIRDITVKERDDHSARIEMLLDYAPPGEKPVLREQRVIEISAPDEAGRYHLDWAMTFTAGEQEVRLDRTPLPHEPDGKIWGGYAGLACRLADDFRDLRAVSTAGDVTDWKDQRHRSRAPAMEYHGSVGGRPAGVAIIDHPGNLNAPSPWYLINSDPMRYINPAVICYQPHELAAGESFTLRYRVIVHPGHWGAAELRRQVEKYLSGKEQ
ncbi:MAG: PmoA family protein [Planctomycetes bacterium]|nr:PmoA family protein [Planctomycetota bacterium]